MFTRQHYKAIAEILKTQLEFPLKKDRCPVTHGAAICGIGIDLAEYFYDDNPRFDRDKFMEACGLD